MPAPPLRSLPRPKGLSGLEGLVWVQASDLEENPANWKRHPARQTKALRASLAEHGWIQPLVYNLTTRRLLDGHARRKLDPTAIVPVVVGNWTPEQEKRILLTLDPLGSLSEIDLPAFRSLSESVQGDLASLTKASKAAFASLVEDLDLQAEMVENGSPPSLLAISAEYDDEPKRKGSKKTPETIYNESTDSLGISSLKTREEIALSEWNPQEFDIPSLREDRLASIPTPIRPWVPSEKPTRNSYYLYIFGTGTQGIHYPKTLIGTYTDDRRFEACWNSPEKFTQRLLNLKPKAMLGPNFSIWEGLSRAEELYQIFRTRWVCRYWQEAGLSIIPDIQLGNLLGEGWKYRFIGLPKGLPAIAVNLQTPGDSESRAFFSSSRERLLGVLSKLQPKQLLIYHGTRFPADFLNAISEEWPSLKIVTVMSHMGKLLENKSKR